MAKATVSPVPAGLRSVKLAAPAVKQLPGWAGITGSLSGGEDLAARTLGPTSGLLVLRTGLGDDLPPLGVPGYVALKLICFLRYPSPDFGIQSFRAIIPIRETLCESRILLALELEQ